MVSYLPLSFLLSYFTQPEQRYSFSTQILNIHESLILFPHDPLFLIMCACQLCSLQRCVELITPGICDWPYLKTGSLQIQFVKMSHAGGGWALNPKTGVPTGERNPLCTVGSSTPQPLTYHLLFWGQCCSRLPIRKWLCGQFSPSPGDWLVCPEPTNFFQAFEHGSTSYLLVQWLW